jgi:hypothetical protein
MALQNLISNNSLVTIFYIISFVYIIEMSQFNTNDLFLEPKTTQYGSHMVMTNVTKQSKVKYVNIDTRFRDEYNYSSTANYNITLPQRITDVKNTTLTAIEIPMSIYNISTNLGNNCFNIKYDGNTSTITIPDNYYNIVTLKTAINNSLPGHDMSYNYFSSKSQFITGNSKTVTISFDTTISGGNDKYNIKSKLGWILGFRNLSYDVNDSGYTTSESFIDLNGHRYLYLAIDEFNKGNQYSFISPLYTSLINKNIIARISMDPANHEFGNVLVANLTNGLLVSDVRNYTGKIDLLKMNIQLLDENGNSVNLNGLDFSFCLAVEHE